MLGVEGIKLESCSVAVTGMDRIKMEHVRCSGDRARAVRLDGVDMYRGGTVSISAEDAER